MCKHSGPPAPTPLTGLVAECLQNGFPVGEGAIVQALRANPPRLNGGSLSECLHNSFLLANGAVGQPLRTPMGRWSGSGGGPGLGPECLHNGLPFKEEAIMQALGNQPPIFVKNPEVDPKGLARGGLGGGKSSPLDPEAPGLFWRISETDRAAARAGGGGLAQWPPFHGGGAEAIVQAFGGRGVGRRAECLRNGLPFKEGTVVQALGNPPSAPNPGTDPRGPENGGAGWGPPLAIEALRVIPGALGYWPGSGGSPGGVAVLAQWPPIQGGGNCASTPLPRGLEARAPDPCPDRPQPPAHIPGGTALPPNSYRPGKPECLHNCALKRGFASTPVGRARRPRASGAGAGLASRSACAAALSRAVVQALGPVAGRRPATRPPGPATDEIGPMGLGFGAQPKAPRLPAPTPAPAP